MSTIKAFNITAACAEVLQTAFTKADTRSFDRYYASLGTDAVIDNERIQLASSIDQVFNDFKSCKNIYQIRKLIKDQPINIKAFIFERLVIIFQTSINLGLNEIKSPSADYGEAFSQTIQRLWNHLQTTLQEKGDSVSEYYRYILQQTP